MEIIIHSELYNIISDNINSNIMLIVLIRSLALYANINKQCSLSIAEIAKSSYCCKSSSIKAIKELEKAGLIKIYKKKEGKLHKKNIYEITTKYISIKPLKS